jgi:hypothetical protein
MTDSKLRTLTFDGKIQKEIEQVEIRANTAKLQLAEPMEVTGKTGFGKVDKMLKENQLDVCIESIEVGIY